MPKKIIFLGSKNIGFDCLYCLISQKSTLNIEIVGVLTKNNTLDSDSKNIPQLCKTHQIPIIESLEKMVETESVDILISVQYHRILKQKHIAHASQIAVNLHMAPLPEYRGCNQFSFAIIDKKTEFGTTIHQMGVGIDSGAILFEKRFPIPKNCWVQQLHHLTEKHSLDLFKNSISNLISGDYSPTPQSTLEEKRGTSYHYRHEVNALKQIDLNWNKEKIERHIRATYFPPFEPPYVMMEGKKMYFTI